jgi:hypothetical protein
VFKILEVYEKKVRNVNERADGSEYTTYATRFDTRECLINEDYIVAVYPHEFTSDLSHQRMEESFPENTKFCTMVVDGNSFRRSEFIVLGSFEKFADQLGSKK